MLKTAIAAAALTATMGLTAGPAMACDHGNAGTPERVSLSVAEQSMDRANTERAADLIDLGHLGHPGALDALTDVHRGVGPQAGAEAAEGERAGTDQLTIMVQTGDERSATETYTLDCRPAGGTHSDPAAACEELDGAVEDGNDPFAPVPEESMCTQIHGGPASARITGEWQGEQVDASFSRSNGCEMNRWDSLATVLGG